MSEQSEMSEQSNSVPVIIWDNMVAWEKRAKAAEEKVAAVRQLVQVCLQERVPVPPDLILERLDEALT